MSRKGSSFRFLDLPPELRNHVYHLLLRIEGPISPSTEPPTSAPQGLGSLKVTESENTESALSIVSVCKQLNEEAMGIYYNANSFLFHYPTQLNAFLLAIGKRQKFISDITMYYHNLKVGGVELIDLTLPLLANLTGLKKLHVIMISTTDESTLRRGWWQGDNWGLRRMKSFGANPARIPGLHHLFNFRGITDLKVKDLLLEEKVEQLRLSKSYPRFIGDEPSAKAIKLANAFEHFNAALADAQLGRVNERLMEDEQWQWWDIFPTMDSDGVEKAMKSKP